MATPSATGTRLDLSGETSRPARRTALDGLLVPQGLRAVLAAFLVTRLMILFIIYVSTRLLPNNPQLVGIPTSPYLRNHVLDGLVRWDSKWYARIAAHGYGVTIGGGRDVVFSPFYPLVVKIVSIPIHNVYVAGLLVSNAAFFVALCYLYALACREFDDEAAGRTVFYLAAAPAAVIFAAMYTESLFVALVAATFYYARAGRWVGAALAGALAAATRNTGVIMAVVIALEAVSARGADGAPLSWRPRETLARLQRRLAPATPDRRGLAAAAFVPVGLLAYMAYLGAAFHDPLAFVHAQSAWKGISAQSVGTTTGGASGALAATTAAHAGLIYFNALALIAFAPLVLGVVLTMRPSYGVYALLTYALPPILGHGLLSFMRFTLMLLPCYLLLGRWGRRPWVDRLVLGLSLPLMAYLALTFSHWYAPPAT